MWLGFGCAFAYFLLPNHFSYGMGGFLQNRLAVVAPLFWLACCRESKVKPVRYGLRAAAILVLIGNLMAVDSYVREQNGYLAEYNAGIAATGNNHVLFATLAGNRPMVDPLRDAASYYCLGTGNIDLRNLFADKGHSPVRFRAGIESARRATFDSYRNADLVDLLVFWDRNTGPFPDQIPGLTTIFERGRLKMMARERK